MTGSASDKGRLPESMVMDGGWERMGGGGEKEFFFFVDTSMDDSPCISSCEVSGCSKLVYLGTTAATAPPGVHCAVALSGPQRERPG